MIRRIAWSAWALTVVTVAAMVVLGLVNRQADVALGIVISLTALGYGTTGSLIVARHPRHTVGWLFLLIGFCVGFAGFAENYLMRSLELGGPGALPLVELVAMLGSNVALVVGFGSIPLVVLLFPDGLVPSPRWRPIGILIGVAMVCGVAGFALSTNQLGGEARIPNPTAVPGLDQLASWLLTVSGVGFVGGGALCVAGLVVRFRRSRGAERQQLRWLAYSAGVAAALLLSTFTVGSLDEGPASDVIFMVFITMLGVGIPVSCGIAILRHGLYGIDVVINKALVYGALAAFITAVYVGIVVGVGSLVGAGGEPNLALSILATALVALAFQPVRERIQRVANRLVYGRRTSPYEVLSTFASQVGGSYAIDDVLPRMARVVAEGTGSARAEVWLAAAGELRPAAAWPAGAVEDTARAAVPLAGDTPGPIPDSDRTVAVRHGGELLGALSITKPAGEPLRPAEAGLLDDLASQAGLLVRNARLAADLRARLDQLSRQAEELRESRSRVVEAEDAERRRLERDIHDGAQQNLVALAVKLRLARTLAGKDPERAISLIEDLRRDTVSASETLAALARGIYPPLLSEGGLVPALQAHVRGLPFAVEVQTHDVGRYGDETEAAVYFSILEALQNAAKYADASRVELVLRQTGEGLEFTVRDDGRGFDADRTTAGSGTRNMADRLESLGGRVTVESAPGRGTTVAGFAPAAAMAVSG
jgi:signal transduction histidine kinase